MAEESADVPRELIGKVARRLFSIFLCVLLPSLSRFCLLQVPQVPVLLGSEWRWAGSLGAPGSLRPSDRWESPRPEGGGPSRAPGRGRWAGAPALVLLEQRVQPQRAGGGSSRPGAPKARETLYAAPNSAKSGKAWHKDSRRQHSRSSWPTSGTLQKRPAGCAP